MQLSRVYYKEAWADERLDAEFFQPEFLRNANLVDKKNKIFQFIENKTPTINRENIGIFNYLEIANISTSSLEHHSTQLDPSVEPIPTRATYSLKKDDVLVSTVRPNRSAIAFIADEKNLVATNGCVVLRAKRIEPEYLFAFCKTEYFIKHQMRANKASMYPAVSSQDIFNTPIFLPSNEFKESIVIKIKKSLSYHKKFKEEFFLANQILTKELNFSIPKSNNSVSFFFKNYSTIQSTRRMDADYFQPKYEQTIKNIKKYKEGYTNLNNLTTLIKGIEVGGEEYLAEGTPFVRVSNISPFNISEEKYISEQTYRNNIIRQPRKGEILLTKDASPGIAHHLSYEPPKMIPSSGVLRLRLRNSNLSAECLTLILNSPLVQMQMERDCGGSVILHWNTAQVEKIKIPLLEIGIQSKINNKVSQAILAYQHSKNLLQIAKRAVEIAIEKGETKAKAWLEKQE